MEKYAKLIEAIHQFQLLSLGKAKTYGPYMMGNGRQIVIIVDEEGNRRTVSYPKYLLEQHLGRQLDKDKETVDHIDLNKDNNDLSNLRIMPREEHSREDTRRVKLIKLVCDWCGDKFERSPRLLRDKSKKGVTGVFCSKSCAGKYSRSLQLGKIDKLPVQPYIESEYYRKKHIKSGINYLLEKYGKLI